MSPERWTCFCTVFTPTYNRAYILPRLYASLQRQTERDFEWLIVDDGSTDGTGDLVRKWQAEASFPIRYEWQENAGKHVADNRGTELARGELLFTAASDDALTSEALAILRREWNLLGVAEKERNAGVWGLCREFGGKLIGTRFPVDRWDAGFAEAEARGVRGDKCTAFRTDVLREFPFPVIPGEKFQAEGAVWRRISRKYAIRMVNEVLQEKEYLPDGLIASTVRMRMSSPQGARMNYREMWLDPLPYGLWVKSQVNFARFSFHAGMRAADVRRECPPGRLRALWVACGWLYHRFDRWRTARPGAATPPLRDGA